MTRKLGWLRLRLGDRQSQVSGGIERLAHRQWIFAVELSQRRRSPDYFLVLVRTWEIIQSEEIHLFGAPNITAGQSCVSVDHRNVTSYQQWRLLHITHEYAGLYKTEDFLPLHNWSNFQTLKVCVTVTFQKSVPLFHQWHWGYKCTTKKMDGFYYWNHVNKPD